MVVDSVTRRVKLCGLYWPDSTDSKVELEVSQLPRQIETPFQLGARPSSSLPQVYLGVQVQFLPPCCAASVFLLGGVGLVRVEYYGT